MTRPYQGLSSLERPWERAWVYKIAFIAIQPFSDNRGQKLLGRLRASVHLIRLFSLLAVFSILVFSRKYLGNIMPPSPIFNVGVLQARKVTIFFPGKSNIDNEGGGGVSVK